MSELPPIDPTTERRLADAFTALATAEVPASAPRPAQPPRPPRSGGGHGSRRRWQIAGGSLLAVAAAVVVALVVGTEVNDARTSPTAPPATRSEVSVAPTTPTIAAPTTSPTTPTGPTTASTGTTGTTGTPGGAVTTGPPRSSGGAGAPGLCTPTVMTFSVTDLHPAAGSAFFEVHARNGSASSCVTTGFPGLALLDASGHQILQASRDTSVAPTTIVVAPGHEVVARVQASDVVRAGATSCPVSPAFLLTLPDNTDPTTIRHTTPACGAEVRVFVAG